MFFGKSKDSACLFLLALMMLACMGCQKAPADLTAQTPIPVAISQPEQQTQSIPVEQAPTPGPTSTPALGLKYIFLFIGDGMGPNQVLAVNEALAAQGMEPLCFTNFPVQGQAITNNAFGKVTDSAASATAIATGYKTANGALGIDSDGVRRTSIAQTLHISGMGVGILTTVSLDNATPAGFYAHTDSRTNYGDIAADLFISGFDYFAGGGFHDGGDIDALASQFGYTLVNGDEEGAAAGPTDKLVLMATTLTADRGMPLALDADSVRSGQLARNLERGVARLTAPERGTDKGFFIMCEGGRIDLACHYHDPGELYAETLDFDLAVQAAVAFYQAHPNETLLVVTADHETGDLSLTQGDRSALAKQQVSCDAFDKTATTRFQAEKTSFQEALPEICSAFGLDDLSNEETSVLKTAYSHTLRGDLSKAQIRSRYGVYSPIASAAANLVSQRAGVTFNAYGHSGVNVGVYALGVGAEVFSGEYENTAICEKLTQLVAQYGH